MCGTFNSPIVCQVSTIQLICQVDVVQIYEFQEKKNFERVAFMPFLTRDLTRFISKDLFALKKEQTRKRHNLQTGSQTFQLYIRVQRRQA